LSFNELLRIEDEEIKGLVQALGFDCEASFSVKCGWNSISFLTQLSHVWFEAPSNSKKCGYIVYIWDHIEYQISLVYKIQPQILKRSNIDRFFKGLKASKSNGLESNG